MKPALDIIVPAYNSEGTLGQTLTSLLTQTRGDWRAIVVDDGSTDSTARVARSFADHRILLIRQHNQGLPAARNAGLQAATSPAPFAAFLDADDAWDPRFVETMLDAVRDADLAACAVSMRGPTLEPLAWTVAVPGHELNVDGLLCANPLAVGAAVVRHTALDRASLAAGVWFDTALKSCEDWDLWLRLLSAGARVAAPRTEPLFHYRLASGTMSTHAERMWQAGRLVLERHTPPDRRVEVLRAWDVRQLAPVAATGDATLLARLFAPLAERWSARDDAIVIAGVLPACCRIDRLGPAAMDGTRLALWAARLRETFTRAGITTLHAAIDLGLAAVTLETIAATLSQRRSQGRLVLYGMGRNGLELARLLRQHGTPYLWIDDHPTASHAAPRLEPADLAPTDLVILTPTASAGMADRLPPGVVALPITHAA